MFVIGVTGPSGAGKGTVCAMLQSRGFYHIDCDRLVPSVYGQILPELSAAFGKRVIKNGAVDKKRLARAAFSSPENTEKLNRIVHPAVVRGIEREIQAADAAGYRGAAVDGAALFEAQAERLCDKVLCVLAPAEVRLQRILNRDKITADAAKLRMNAQKEDGYYSSRADAVIINQNAAETERQLETILKEWLI